MIVFERFSFTYPDATAPALREVSLTLPAGSFTLVAGPSGGGKSTLLRALNGLVPHFSGGHASGRVRVDGLDPVSVGPVGMAARVGFVFQDPEAQFVTGQVEDEIAFALENAGLPRPEMAARIEAVLSALGLTALRGREIATLSGGQMQRVAIASALVLRPGILVLDEPTSQLDPAAAEETLEAVLALRERFALTVVLAEHRLERVLPFATHLLLVEGGRARLGAPAAMLGDAPDIAPPLARLARGLGWPTVPLSVEAARPLAASQRVAAPARTTMQAQGRVRLAVRGLRVRYPGPPPVTAVDGVTFAVGEGECVVVLGPNGAGKSSVLRALIGLVAREQGEVAVDDRPVTGLPTWQICRAVAYLTQNPNLLLFAESVREELRATLRNHGWPREGQDAAIARALRELGLEGHAARHPRDLSTGERQRVAFGAVTVTAPGVALLDEPTRGMDAAAKAGLAALLRAWKVERQAALLVVTHDLAFAAEIADRVIVMENGRIVAEGDPRDVLPQHPAFTPHVSALFPGFLTPEEVIRAAQPAPSARPATPA